MLFFSGFLNIVWEYVEIDYRWKFARRDFLKKDLNKLFFVEDFPNHFSDEWSDYTQPRKKGTQGFYKQVG